MKGKNHGPPRTFLAEKFRIAVRVSAKFCKSFFAPEAVADSRTKSAKLLRECIPQFSEPIKKGTTHYTATYLPAQHKIYYIARRIMS